MKWITREKIKVDRVACPWLIREFVDPDAEFVFLPHDTVGHGGFEDDLRLFAECAVIPSRADGKGPHICSAD
ncbi:MAG TPA: chromate resistance protein ChrB domain-containing protein [Chthoniobacterales bacterium]|nr:chromate resistance protein ChrB domain-containing protein [Chthoniobacterales bacterium]